MVSQEEERDKKTMLNVSIETATDMELQPNVSVVPPEKFVPVIVSHSCTSKAVWECSVCASQHGETTLLSLSLLTADCNSGVAGYNNQKLVHDD